MNFYKKISSMNNKDYIEKLLVFNTSLVISGEKPSSTISIDKMSNKYYSGWIQYGKIFINKLELKILELRENTKSIIILVYNEKHLKKYLCEKGNKDFLINIGYKKNATINEWLETLKKRYNLYHCPHELGIFLGFPLNDVIDFIECKDKECLLCGYWKVYNNVNKAKALFEKYDKIKNETIINIVNNRNVNELINSIKYPFKIESAASNIL